MSITPADTIRRALEALPNRCRYHGDNTTPDRPGWGREACCDTGTPAQRRKLAEQALDQLAAADTCDASLAGVGANPIGPCVLRHGHDGPIHQAADGAKWWPEQQTQPVDWAAAPITVVDHTPRFRYPTCDSGRHIAHPGTTCAEEDADRDAMAAVWNEWMEQLASMPPVMPPVVPPALRGPNFPQTDPEETP